MFDAHDKKDDSIILNFCSLPNKFRSRPTKIPQLHMR